MNNQTVGKETQSNSNQSSDRRSNRKIQREKNRRFLKQVVVRNKVVEVMVKGKNGPLAFAWCDSVESIQDIVNQLKIREVDYTDVFMTINKPKEDAYAEKTLNKLFFPKKSSQTCFKDEDIDRINFLFVDVDPVAKDRPVSRDVNLACGAVCKLINKELIALGFTDAAEVNSGNGAALFFPLKGYPNSPKVKDAISSFLKYLGEKYSDDVAQVDVKVGNASRYCRVPGTVNYKNYGGSEENFRYCKVINFPFEFQPLPSKYFRQIATTCGISLEDSIKEKNAVVDGNAGHCVLALDVEKYLEHYNVKLSKIKHEKGFTLYCLEKCAFNQEHGPNEAAIVQQANGKLSYQCFHGSCKDKPWFDAKEKISGSDSLRPFLKGTPINFGRSTSDLSDVTVMSLSEILARDYKSTPLIKNLVDENEAVIWGGPPGVGKSALTCAIGLNGATAPKRNLFDMFEFTRPFATLFVQSEVTGKHIQNRFQLFIKYWPDLKEGISKISFLGRGDSCRITAKFSDPKFQELLIKAIIEYNVELVIVDPLISYIDGLGENDNGAMRKELDCLKRACEYANASVILIHHTGKDGKGLRGASAIDGWADRIILMEPVKKDGEECFRLVFEKTRNQEKFASILIKKTGLRFERIPDSHEDEMDLVVSALKEFPDGIAETQTALVKKICDTKGMKDSSARRRIKEAIECGLIVEDDQGSAKSYMLAKR